MRLIKPSFEIIEQQASLEGMYKQIELAGRTCYKSEDKITEDSSRDFVNRMIKSGHGAMLEHGTVYLYFPWVSIGGTEARYTRNKYSKSIFYSNVKADKDLKLSFIPIEYGKAGHYITTNFRVLVKNGWLDDLKYLCAPTEHHEKRVTVRFICDRGVSHEFVRHRVFSFAQESTRYCNYSKDKFGNELTFIIPCWMNDSQKNMSLEGRDICGNTYAEVCFKENLIKIEKTYFTLLKEGWRPQQARAILPNSLKTELIMTGFLSDWKHFFALRDAGSAHPQAQELAKPLHEEFIKRGYIKD